MAESQTSHALVDGPRSAGELRWQVRELVEEWRADGRYRPRPDAWLRSFDLDFSKALAGRGLIGMTWPKSFGGGECTAVDRFVVTEELLRAGAPVAAHWIGDRQIGPSILRHGNPRLQEEILPRITSGELVFCLGMSEPTAGSDLAAVKTSARKVQGGWRVSGRKTWTSNAHKASHAYLLARTSVEGRKHRGLSEFIVDMQEPGVTVSPIVDMSGEHHFNEFTLEDVFVPDHYLIGECGNGWSQVVEQLSFERGGPERVLTTYPLLASALAALAGSEDRGLHRELGMLVARLATLRRLGMEIARSLDEGMPSIARAATLKLLGNAFETDVIDFARKVVGDPEGERLYRESLLASPGFSIRGGASDVLLSIIAKQVASA